MITTTRARRGSGGAEGAQHDDEDDGEEEEKRIGARYSRPLALAPSAAPVAHPHRLSAAERVSAALGSRKAYSSQRVARTTAWRAVLDESDSDE